MEKCELENRDYNYYERKIDNIRLHFFYILLENWETGGAGEMRNRDRKLIFIFLLGTGKWRCWRNRKYILEIDDIHLYYFFIYRSKSGGVGEMVIRDARFKER